MKIKDILKKLMIEKRETLVSISRKTGVPKSTVADWLTNRTPNPLQAALVAKHFGVSLYFLLFGCEDPQGSQTEFDADFLSGTFEVNIKRLKLK